MLVFEFLDQETFLHSNGQTIIVKTTKFLYKTETLKWVFILNLIPVEENNAFDLKCPWCWLLSFVNMRKEEGKYKLWTNFRIAAWKHSYQFWTVSLDHYLEVS